MRAGVFDASNDNVLVPGTSGASAPIASISRAASVTLNGNLVQRRVIDLDPRPANAALTSVDAAPEDGFFTRANYRGAFSPDAEATWLAGWSSSEAFGFSASEVIGATYCTSQPNANGLVSSIRAIGSVDASANDLTLEATDVPRNQFGIFFTSSTAGSGPIGNGTICVGGAIGAFQHDLEQWGGRCRLLAHRLDGDPRRKRLRDGRCR